MTILQARTRLCRQYLSGNIFDGQSCKSLQLLVFLQSTSDTEYMPVDRASAYKGEAGGRARCDCASSGLGRLANVCAVGFRCRDGGGVRLFSRRSSPFLLQVLVLLMTCFVHSRAGM